MIKAPAWHSNFRYLAAIQPIKDGKRFLPISASCQCLETHLHIKCGNGLRAHFFDQFVNA